MSPNPNRATTAGRVFNDLRNMARRQGGSTDELIVHYVLERFLYRVSVSAYREKLVLKGGLLLAVMDARRATRDADLLARDMDRDLQNVLTVVAEVAAMEVDDGVQFSADSARVEPIREDARYTGVRIVVPALLGKARTNLSLDVNFGDPVTPGAVHTEFPCLLGHEAFSLLCYPIETVLAEKITTMVSLGDLNTRDRDWADVWRLTGRHELAGDVVEAALRRTAAYREIRIRPLSEVVDRLPQLRRPAYMAWLRRQSAAAASYPQGFDDVVKSVIGFADPALSGGVAGRKWLPSARTWSHPASGD